MYNDYLIPANTKKGQLILGLFRKFDLILFGSGILVTMLLLITLPIEGVLMSILALAPAMVTGFLVIPVPNYHNILVIIIETYEFLTNRQTYRWKGWCYKSGKKQD